MEQPDFGHGDDYDIDWNQPHVENQDSSSSYVQSSAEEVEGVPKKIRPRDSIKAAKSRSAGRLPKDSIASSPTPLGSKKRKADNTVVTNHSVKRMKGAVNHEYRNLLNDEIHDAVARSLQNEHEDLHQSQIGATVWTSAEKASFFTALSRLGKDNVSAISSRIGTKSELEVRTYLSLLHQGMLEKNLMEQRQQSTSLSDLPAAFQISKECCEMLERAADALSLRQEQHEERIERSRWGDAWQLTSEHDESILEPPSLEGDGTSDFIGMQDSLPASDLLNLRNWLELSSRIFMNPASPFEDGNWRYIAEPGENPGIRATAFKDFQNLAVSITKKLVAATVFCAKSRLRAMDTGSFSRRDIIKSVDVEAAAKTIGLEVNSRDFWRDCPRRCHLEVYRKLSKNLTGNARLTFEELEDCLGNEGCETQSKHESDTSDIDAVLTENNLHVESSGAEKALVSSSDSEYGLELDDFDDSEPLRRDLASEYLQAERLDFDGPIDPSDTEYQNLQTKEKHALKRLRNKRELERAHHKYAQAFDIQASLMEEQKLWDVLKQEPPFAIKPEDIDLPSHPVQVRKEGPELEDWRVKLKYRSPWEMLNMVPPTGNSTKTPKITRGRWKSVTGSESDSAESRVDSHSS